MDLAIVVAAFDRPDSLARLLNSLKNSKYPAEPDIELIISIDYSGENNCKEIAEQFIWEKGKKSVISHSGHLGLKKHILYCGDLVYNFDGIILLEDDLFVSPAFYYYSLQSVKFYQTIESIAGISLYSYERNEFSDLPFSTIKTGEDSFFMKVPSSWGQIFLKSHWLQFKNYLNTGVSVLEEDFLPDAVIRWPDTSWKKLYFKYMLENDLYFVYPVDSYTSNVGDKGTHYPSTVSFLKTNLSLKKDNFFFSEFNNSLNIYDQFMEWEPGKICFPENIKEKWEHIEIDLYGSKPLRKIRKSLIITSRKASQQENIIPILLHPIQLNLLFDIKSKNYSTHCFYITNIDKILDESNPIYEYFTSCMNQSLLLESYKKGIYMTKKTKKYKLGNFFLSPFQKIKNMISGL